MARPEHTLVTWHGIFTGTGTAPLEEWQFGLRLGPVVFADDAARKAAATACKNAWQTHLAFLFPSITKLDKTRVAQVNGAGLVSTNASGGYNQADDLTVVPGTGALAAVHSTQLALCVSLNTARAGASGKGRVFLPMTKHSLSSTDYRLSAGDVGSIADAMVLFIEAVDTAFVQQGSPGGNVVVASTKGFLSPVTGLRVGRVPDMQRRRRGDLMEDYVTRPIDYLAA